MSSLLEQTVLIGSFGASKTEMKRLKIQSNELLGWTNLTYIELFNL